jgi:hypothetical protein
MRTLGGLILATVVGLVLGAIKDYLKLFPETAWAYTWPFAMGGAAFIGALLMALMRPVATGTAAARPFPQAKAAGQKPGAASNRPSSQYGNAPAAGGSTSSPVGSSSEVPGMPTFDFDKARAAGGTRVAPPQPMPSDKPREKQ